MVRGASAAVARTLNSDGSLSAAARVEVAKCLCCDSALEFTTGRFGQTLERCTMRGCVNNRWHRVQLLKHPIPEPGAIGPAPKKYRRRGPGSGGGPRKPS